MLWTAELDETILFYTATLGFTIGEKNEEWGWAALYRDGVEIMLAKPNEHTVFEKPVFTGSLYFTADDVDALWCQLKDKVQVCYPPENFEWNMREFGIYDNNGYLLQFGAEINV